MRQDFGGDARMNSVILARDFFPGCIRHFQPSGMRRPLIDFDNKVRNTLILLRVIVS